jgi:type I protein arginine methyltransferase
MSDDKEGAPTRGLLNDDDAPHAPAPPPSSSASGDDEDGHDQRQQQDDQEWDEWGDDNDNASDDDDPDDSDRTRSLFDPPHAPPLPSPLRALDHDTNEHGFDLRAWRRRCGLDQYGVIRAVNWARRCVLHEGKDPRPALRAYEEAVMNDGGGRGGGGGDGASAAAPPPPAAPWSGDEFLVPVIPDDPLVTYDYEEEEEEAGEEDREEEEEQQKRAAASSGATPAIATPPASSTTTTTTTAHLLERLAAENAALRAQLQALVEATLPEELRDECSLVGGGGGGGGGSSKGAAAGAATATTAATAAAPQPKPTTTASVIDAAYFDSYSHFDIHREMLSDAPRTEAYRQALELNPLLTRGARVVDVGAGTGVLSLFAARGGGARHVTGIEGSARMAGIARRVAHANGLAHEQGGPVAIVSGRVEELVVAARVGGENDGNTDDTTTTTTSLLPPLNSADVLVSEWMGYALLFESMLSSVLTARDAWLRQGGAVLPDVARVVVAGADLRAALGCRFWDDVYGLKMTPVGDEVVDGVLLGRGGGRGGGGGGDGKDGGNGGGGGKEDGDDSTPDATAKRPSSASSSSSSSPRLLVRQVPAAALRTEPALVRELDLATMSHDDQDFTAEFECCCCVAAQGEQSAAAAAAAPPTPDKGGVAGPPSPSCPTTTTTISCLVLWFDTLFTERFCRDHPVTLTTAPTAKPTHWAQAVLPLSRSVLVEGGGGGLRGRLSMARRQGRHRALDISLEYWPDGPKRASVVQMYSMGVNQDADEE